MSQFSGDYGWERKERPMTMEGVNIMLQEVLRRMKAMDERLMVIEASRPGQDRRRCEKRDKMKETPAESRKLIAPLHMLKEEGNYFEYVEAFVELVSQVKMSDEEQVERFVEGLRNQNHKLISVLHPRTLQQAISYGRALTTDVDPKATNQEWISTVMELRKPNEMQEERKSHVKVKGDEDEPVDQPKVEKERSAVPHGLSTDFDVMKGKEESVPRRSLCNKAEEFEFQVEGSRLTNILVHSLYDNKDKVVLGDNDKLEIHIRVDQDKKILIIRDRGTGMTKEDLIKSLGTMARSGSLASVGKMQTIGDLDRSGQFGVGFYSVPLVTENAEVDNKHDGDEQNVWKSKADGFFAISEDAWQEPVVQGTEIRFHLREEAGKYPFGHKYISKRLNSISLDSKREGYSTEEESILEGKGDLNSVNSLQVVYKVYMLPMNRTMKMTGYYKKMRLIVLVNSGSIHNFLDAALVKGMGCFLQPVRQHKGSEPLLQQNLDGNQVGQLSWVLQFVQTNYLFAKRKGVSENNLLKKKEGLALTSQRTVDNLLKKRDRLSSIMEDKKNDSSGQYGSSSGAIWLEMDKDDREDTKETELEDEMSDPNGVNQNAEVNKISYNYSVSREEMDESDWENGNIKGINSNKDMAEVVRKLTKGDKFSDSAMALALESHEGSPEEDVALTVAFSRSLQLIARVVSIWVTVSLRPDFGKSNCCSQEMCDEGTELLKSPVVMMVPGSMTIQETMMLCFQENSKGLKGRGNIELDMHMTLSATTVRAHQISVNSSAKIQSGPSLPKGMPTFQGETSSCYPDVSTAVGVRRIGCLIYWTELLCSQENLTGRRVHANAVNAIVVGEEGVEAAGAAYRKYLRYMVALLENQARTEILIPWIDKDFNQVTWGFLWNPRGKYSDCTLGDKGAPEEGVLLREIIGGKKHKRWREEAVKEAELVTTNNKSRAKRRAIEGGLKEATGHQQSTQSKQQTTTINKPTASSKLVSL